MMRIVFFRPGDLSSLPRLRGNQARSYGCCYGCSTVHCSYGQQGGQCTVPCVEPVGRAGHCQHVTIIHWRLWASGIHRAMLSIA